MAVIAVERVPEVVGPVAERQPTLALDCWVCTFPDRRSGYRPPKREPPSRYWPAIGRIPITPLDGDFK